jgi:hypothetical protein
MDGFSDNGISNGAILGVGLRGMVFQRIFLKKEEVD